MNTKDAIPQLQHSLLYRHGAIECPTFMHLEKKKNKKERSVGAPERERSEEQH